MIMILVHDKSIVLRLIQKATENSKTETKGILGKKALQKSIYFFSLKHGYFHFRWADYGPFNAEVQQIVQDLVHSNKINIREIQTKKKSAVIQNMQYNADSETFEHFPEDMDKTLDHIVDFIEGKSPRDLELLASVHYWAQKQQYQTDSYNAEYIHEKLTELKPGAGFTRDNVEWALQKLAEGKFWPRLEE